MTARAVRKTEVRRSLLRQVPDMISHVELPPEPWFVQGPRGGWYVATGERTRLVTDGDGYDEFVRNVVTIIDQSEGVKYLWPGSRLHREATA